MAGLNDIIRAGSRIFVAGSAGEPKALSADILAQPSLSIITSLVPGINRLDAAMIGEDTAVSGPFMAPALQAAQRAGRYRHLPLSYAGMVKYLRAGEPFDACLVHVSPPDPQGQCSLGPSAEFMPAVLTNSRRVVAVVNAAMPRAADGPTLMLRDCAAVVEGDAALVAFDPGPVSPKAQRIAANVARFIDDGATVQCGLGKVPAALMGALHDRRDLKLHSGMLSDAVIDLAAAGALAADAAPVTTVLLGSRRLYDWLGGGARISIRGAEYVHSPATLAGIDSLVAVNSALEVDLFGQCNLEHADGAAVSGVGGAADFARGARLSHGGISVIALPATFGVGDEARSRIVARLDPGAIASLARTDIDVIVTEYGHADLRGRSVHERAEAIITVAAPDFHDELERAWHMIVANL